MLPRLLRLPPAEPGADGAPIVGASAPLREVLRQVASVAATDATVLIQGETGTGKELIAQAIQAASGRRARPYVPLNTAAIPAALLESELYGHERGAFTGAVTRRLGRFELARDGTIFLDEIGELDLALQPKLLRVLQEREFERLGGARTLRTAARLVAATNRDLLPMVQAGAFREDLYYRLAVFPIRLSSLRERRDDIPLLVAHFLDQMAARAGKVVAPPSPPTLARLQQHDWPGNIRELQNAIERAVILAAGGPLQIELPRARAGSGAAGGDDALASVERAHILRVLARTNWVVGGPAGAAARLAMNRTTLNHRMKKLGIRRPDGAQRVPGNVECG